MWNRRGPRRDLFIMLAFNRIVRGCCQRVLSVNNDDGGFDSVAYVLMEMEGATHEEKVELLNQALGAAYEMGYSDGQNGIVPGPRIIFEA